MRTETVIADPSDQPDEQEPVSNVPEDLEFWREQLMGTPAHIELPSSETTPTALGRVSGRIDLLGGAEEIAIRAKIFAAFAAVLTRYGSPDDLVFAYVRAAEDIVPLRLQIPPDSTFAQLVTLAQVQLTEADARGPCPGDLVPDVSRLRVRIGFADAAAPRNETAQLGGAVSGGTSSCDLYMSVVLNDAETAGVTLEVSYNAAVLDGAGVARLLGHVDTLSAGGAAERRSAGQEASAPYRVGAAPPPRRVECDRNPFPKVLPTRAHCRSSTQATRDDCCERRQRRCADLRGVGHAVEPSCELPARRRCWTGDVGWYQPATEYGDACRPPRDSQGRRGIRANRPDVSA